MFAARKLVVRLPECSVLSPIRQRKQWQKLPTCWLWSSTRTNKPFMNRSNPWKSYREVATQTAPRGQLVLMLFDGALRFLDRALMGFSKDDPAEFNQTISNNIIRAQDIIGE